MTTVLTFHRVVDRLEQDHDLTWDSFRRLADSVSASITDLESPSSARAITMTFDDGTEDHLRAAEELQRRALPAVFFISAADIGSSGRLDAGQVHELVSMGHAVGSHALHHRPLARLALEQLRDEVRESRARLEAICEEPVVFFAPPGGIGHHALASVLRSEAYRACRTARWGIYRDPVQRWEIPCVPVTEYTWQRGWVGHAIERHSLPLRMRLGRSVKEALPAGLVTSIRGSLHARVHGPGGPTDA
jgi:peptidoglycan/xylan/chitin deacetylase (PgdA/CDA1 family)